MSRAFTQTDLQAPRFRKKSKSILDKKLYKNFIEKYSDYSELSYKDFKLIIKTFNKEVVNKVIEETSGVDLPQHLGTLLIAGYKPVNNIKNINFSMSNKYGKEVKNRNIETGDLACKIFYSNYRSKLKVKNGKFWRFVGHRDFKRQTSEAFQKNYNKYVFVTKTTKISSLYT
jgi:hypothetical protein